MPETSLNSDELREITWGWWQRTVAEVVIAYERAVS